MEWLRYLVLGTGLGTASLLAQPTSVALSASSNPVVFGQSVTLTATVSPVPVGGSVTFYDGTAVLGTRSVSNGQTALTTSLLGPGNRALRAYFGGSGSFAASTSPLVTETVNVVPGNAFQAPVNYTFNTIAPNQLALADFNGDGKTDVAVVNFVINGGVSVLLGNGDGTLRVPLNSPAGSQPYCIAVGDFNGDGKADLAVGDFDANGVGILLGNGDGTFQPRVGYGLGVQLTSIALGDFNGDGKSDLAISAGGLYVMLGRGDGTFQNATNYGSAKFVVTGDFNNDGKTDLAVADAAAAGILLGNGDGTFQPVVYTSAGTNPYALAVGDFNADGKADLAVVDYSTGNNLNVLLGNGNGTFRPAVAYFTGSNATSVVVSDFNGDGIADLAVANGRLTPINALSVLMGNGDGTFQAASQYGPLFATSVAAGDFNGDGRVDLVAVGGQTVSILLRQVLPVPTVGLTSSVNPSLLGQIVSLTVTVLPATATGVVTFFDGTTLLGASPLVNGQAVFTTQYLTPGSHVIKASYGGDVNFAAATSPIVVQLVGSVGPSPTVFIDFPLNGTTVFGHVLVTGWALDSAAGIGTAINKVQVSVDGTVVGNATYGGYRPDVCGAYPGRPGCPNVGFSFSLGLTPGTHTVTVSATDSDPVPDTGSASITLTSQSLIPGTRAGVFRTHTIFLEDSNGSGGYDAGIDRFIPNFTGPGGFLDGDSPVTGDWTGDGHTKIGIYRASTGQWFLDANDNGVYDAGDFTYSFGGLPGDMPFVGDWNGLGKSCVGIYRSAGSVWLLDLNCNGTFDNTPADAFFPFGGLAGDVPVVGNWRGGTTRVGVVRKYAPGGVPQGNPFFWVLDASPANKGNTPADHPAGFAFAFGGLPGDVFVTGDWFNNGVSMAGVYRAGFWVLDTGDPGAGQNSHLPGLTFGYGGVAGDIPITGRW